MTSRVGGVGRGDEARVAESVGGSVGGPIAGIIDQAVGRGVDRRDSQGVALRFKTCYF